MNEDSAARSDATGRRMVEGVARVVAVDGAKVWLEAESMSACAGCAAKAGCGTSAQPSRRTPRRFAATNDLDARIGERMVVGIPENALLRASATAYLVPLLAMIVAAVAASGLGGGDGAAALAAVAGLAAGLAFARRRAAMLTAHGGLTPVSLRRAGEALDGAACRPPLARG